MTTSKRQFTMRMQAENFDKIRFIALVNKRSVAMQIEYLIEKCIAEYENKNGEINFNEKPQDAPPQIVQNNNNGNNILTAGNSKNYLAFI